MQVTAITPVSFALRNGQNKFSSRTKRTAQMPQSIPLGTMPAPKKVQAFQILPKTHNVSFNGILTPADLIVKYLAARAVKTSSKAPRRMHLPLDKDLESIAQKVNIQIHNGEIIEAFDINPKKSDKYLIYLHGFSQNITSNQPLYKSLVPKNFGILAIDYRGYGKNPLSKNTRETNLAEDVMAAAEYLKSKGIIPNLKDYVVLPRRGYSMDDGKIEAITNIIGNL